MNVTRVILYLEPSLLRAGGLYTKRQEELFLKDYFACVENIYTNNREDLMMLCMCHNLSYTTSNNESNVIM